MKCKERFTDKFSFKFTKNTFLTVIIFLGGIIGWFIRGWYSDVNIDRAAFAKDIQILKQDNYVFKETMPKIEKKLDRLINMHLGK